MLETERHNHPKRDYPGGYVKEPTKKIVNASFGIDFSGLYPNTMITMGISPDSKLDKILVNEFGYPINNIEHAKWMKFKQMGCCLLPTGRIYQIDKEYLYTKIELGLLEQRKVFKVPGTEPG